MAGRVAIKLGDAGESVPTFRRTGAESSRARRGVRVGVVGLCTLMILGAGTRQTVQWAREQRDRDEVVAVESNDGLPRLVLRSPLHNPIGFSSSDTALPPRALLVRDAISIRMTRVDPGVFASLVAKQGHEDVSLGTREGRLGRENNNWFVVWRIDDSEVIANGEGAFDRERAEALGAVALTADGRFRMGASRKGFEVRPLPKSYDASYATIVGEANIVSLSVSAPGNPWFNAVVANSSPVRVIERNGRRYEVRESTPGGDVSWVTAKWSVPGADVSLALSGSVEELLRLAELVGEATPRQWTKTVASSSQERRENVLERGKIGDDGLDGAYALVAELLSDSSDCRTIALRWNVGEVSSCVSDDSREPLRLVKAARVKDQPVVFGITSAESPENQVVRVTDAEGDIVGEDVATDEGEIRGRSFAIPLDAAAVAPFTVELFDFDREWYLAEFENGNDQTYVKPGFSPTIRVQVNLEEPTSRE